MNLDGMTQERWDSMAPAERDKARDLSGLTAQLLPYKGDRVEVIRASGEKARFWVGQSTGWRPCSLEIKTRRSCGGGPADQSYRSVRLIERGPRI